MLRPFLIFTHRWAGLAMTAFLVLVSVTGSVLAFKSQLEHLISPQLFAAPRAGVAPLDLAAFAERAETLIPLGRATRVSFAEPDQIVVWMSPRNNAATGKPYELGFDQLLLNPWTGAELARRTYGDISEGFINLIPFVYQLHWTLALGRPGEQVLGIVALIWTMDCFIGFFLTLPAAKSGFWTRWKPAWLIRWRARAFRLNFDLHRANGLWLWPILVIFAWSSVYMNLRNTVYTWTTRAVLDYKTALTELGKPELTVKRPALGWRRAQTIAETLMADEANLRGFQIMGPVALALAAKKGVYIYCVRSSLDIQDNLGKTQIFFDASTGALRLFVQPTGRYMGNTVTSWLDALHMANVFGLPYRIFVCALGVVITMLSVTGVYIWWKKRRARQFSQAHRGAAAAIKEVAAE